MKTLIVLMVCGYLPSTSLATSGYNFFTPTNVTVYQAGQSSAPGGALIIFSTASATGSDTEGCTYSGKGYAWIDWASSSLPDGKALYTSVLAAYLAGKQIGIGLNGCSSGGYPVVYGVNVYP